MLRWLAILALGLSAARGVGIGAPAPVSGDCATPSCAIPATPIAPITPATCCSMSGHGNGPQGDHQSNQKTACPISSGDCRCGVSPSDDDQRPVPAPAPNHERSPMQSVRQASQLVHPAVSDAPAAAAMGSIAHSRRALFTHNGYLSLLGIWRR